MSAKGLIRRRNLEGMKFGRVTVKSFSHINDDRRAVWTCICDCGNVFNTMGRSLTSGRTRSCGCYHSELVGEQNRKRLTKHGKTGSPEYHSWAMMLNRCLNPRARNWKWYGGVGVSVCEEWKEFEKFYADMGNRPAGTSIDRINPYGNYEPSNCRWASRIEQSKNKRSVGKR